MTFGELNPAVFDINSSFRARDCARCAFFLASATVPGRRRFDAPEPANGVPIVILRVLRLRGDFGNEPGRACAFRSTILSLFTSELRLRLPVESCVVRSLLDRVERLLRLLSPSLKDDPVGLLLLPLDDFLRAWSSGRAVVACLASTEARIMGLLGFCWELYRDTVRLSW